MRIDRDAAAVVGDGQAVAGAELDLDPGGEAGDGLVHGIVDDFGGEVVEGAGVGPADIHAGAAANRLEPLEHLDRGRVIAVGRRGRGGGEEVGHLPTAIWRGFSDCQESGGGLSTDEAVVIPRAIETWRRRCD